MRAVRSLVVLVGLVVVFGAACSDGYDNSTASIARLAGHTYESTSVEGHDLVGGTTVKMTFEPDGISVNAGCNTLFGAITISNGTLQVDKMAQTMMACTDDLMAQDTFLVGFFEADPAITLTGRTLRLTGPDATIVAEATD